MFTVTCDLSISPDCLFEADATEPYAEDARKQAQNLGWVKRNGMDICPECLKRSKHKLVDSGIPL